MSGRQRCAGLSDPFMCCGAQRGAISSPPALPWGPLLIQIPCNKWKGVIIVRAALCSRCSVLASKTTESGEGCVSKQAAGPAPTCSCSPPVWKVIPLDLIWISGGQQAPINMHHSQGGSGAESINVSATELLLRPSLSQGAAGCYRGSAISFMS